MSKPARRHSISSSSAEQISQEVASRERKRPAEDINALGEKRKAIEQNYLCLPAGE